MNLSTDIEENIKNLQNYYGINDTFDIITRELLIGNKKAYLLMIDGFAKDQIMLYVIQRLQDLDLKKIKNDNLASFIKKNMAYMEVSKSSDFSLLDSMFLSGAVLLFVEKEENAIIIDAREYPIRSVSEPELEKVTRGPRDGFVETLIFNTALIRRRVKDNNLRFNIKNIGKESKTNIAISYLNNKVDKKLLNQIKNKIDKLDVNHLTMSEKSLSELLFPNKWYNPLPKVRYTERPDVVAAHLFEGHIIIIVDASPSVMIIPTTFFHFTQHIEDYYQTPLVGTYLRQLRFSVILISLFLIPIWYLLIIYDIGLPDSLEFIRNVKEVNVPIFMQLISLEFGIDILKMSSIHTPSNLSTTLGIIGGLILGQFAVDAGILSIEVILMIAITGICSFAIASPEMNYAIKIFRLFLLIMTGIFKLPGFILSLIIILIIIATTNNGSEISYLYPLIPFNWKHLKHILFRFPTPKQVKSKKPSKK